MRALQGITMVVFLGAVIVGFFVLLVGNIEFGMFLVAVVGIPAMLISRYAGGVAKRQEYGR